MCNQRKLIVQRGVLAILFSLSLLFLTGYAYRTQMQWIGPAIRINETVYKELDTQTSSRELLSADVSPESIAVSADGLALYIASRLSNEILVVDSERETVKTRIPVPGGPNGLVLSPCGGTLYVTCGNVAAGLLVIDLDNLVKVETIETGIGACGPLVDTQGNVIVLNQFIRRLLVIDPRQKKVIHQIPAGREPVAAAITPDGSFLTVINHLPEGASDHRATAGGARIFHTRGATIRLIGTKTWKTEAVLNLPAGSTGLKDVCISPDGGYAFVTHIQSNFRRPAEKLERGWINKNALSIISLNERTVLGTVLLDSMDKGAANPWGVACSENGVNLFVTHSGTHELSVIQLAQLIARLERFPTHTRQSMPEYGRGAVGRMYGSRAMTRDDLPNDLQFMETLQERIPLNGLGPRGIAVHGSRVYVTHYFSGSIDCLDMRDEKALIPQQVMLTETGGASMKRWGEFLFHDASICFQGWQSCASCHPEGRADGLNWDLLNDGKGNLKNTKSLIYSHYTPPVMSTGVRASAEVAVRSGIKYILFAERSEEEALAIDAYLKSLKAEPGEILADEELSLAAARGKELFYNRETRCAACHCGKYSTNLRSYNVGTNGPFDQRTKFDTPSLAELWRTAPYLHDGRAATIKDVLTACNANDRHGRTSHLSEVQIADLAAFLLSL